MVDSCESLTKGSMKESLAIISALLLVGPASVLLWKIGSLCLATYFTILQEHASISYVIG